MLTYIYIKLDLFDADMPIVLSMMMLPVVVLLDIIFIPFQYLFYRIWLKRKDEYLCMKKIKIIL